MAEPARLQRTRSLQTLEFWTLEQPTIPAQRGFSDSSPRSFDQGTEIILRISSGEGR
jgi:hypothetical protein